MQNSILSGTFLLKGMIQKDIAVSRVEIDQARLMTIQAARCIDILGSKVAKKQVKVEKSREEQKYFFHTFIF